MKKSNITVVGGGNGAHALAAYLSMLDHEVSIYPGKKFINSVSEIYSRNTITAEGWINGSYPVKGIKDLNLIKKSEILFVIVPAFAQEPLFYEIADYIVDGQMIVSMPGNMGSYCYKRILNELGKNVDVIYGEAISILHGARIIKPGHVKILGCKKSMTFSFLQGRKDEGMRRLQDILPESIELIAAKSPITTMLQNMNGIVHPVTSLLNMGRIDSGKDDFYHYKEGITEHVANVLEELEKERMKISEAYDAECPSFLETVNELYGRYSSIREFAKNSKVHNTMHVAATSINHRYITEDAAYVLVDWLAFAKVAGVETPILESCVTLLSAASKNDIMVNGRNLSKLGFNGKIFNKIYGARLKKYGFGGETFKELILNNFKKPQI